MKIENTCCIIGHNRWCYNMDLDSATYMAALDCISQGVDTFINIWSGGYDLLCAVIINYVKQEIPYIKQYKISPAGMSNFLSHLFDGELRIDKPVHTVMDKVNWALEHSAHALCFVQHDFGPAEIYLQKAKEKGLKIHRVILPEYHYPCNS